MSEILHESTNPHGTLRAIVENDGRTIYFYLWNGDTSASEMRVGWVQNLGRPAEARDAAAMDSGHAPENPIAFCRDPDGVAAPEAASLKVSWLPDGSGAALRVDGVIHAVVPPQPPGQRVVSLSRHAAEDSALARVLRADDPLVQAFDEADAYWTLWEDERFCVAAGEAILAQYESSWGAPANHFSIDNGQWPPRNLVQTHVGDWEVFATVGLSLVPQPNVPRSGPRGPETYRRLELAALIPVGWSEERRAPVVQQLAQMAWFPWAKFTWLGHGHTFTLAFSEADGWESCMLMTGPLPIEKPRLGPVQGDPVNLVFLLPVAKQEVERAKVEAAAAVIEDIAESRWEELARSS